MAPSRAESSDPRTLSAPARPPAPPPFPLDGYRVATLHACTAHEGCAWGPLVVLGGRLSLMSQDPTVHVDYAWGPSVVLRGWEPLLSEVPLYSPLEGHSTSVFCWGCATGLPHSQETALAQEPTVGLCLGPCGGPREVGCLV